MELSTIIEIKMKKSHVLEGMELLLQDVEQELFQRISKINRSALSEDERNRQLDIVTEDVSVGSYQDVVKLLDEYMSALVKEHKN